MADLRGQLQKGLGSGPERFQREIRLAARLQHPTPYYVSPAWLRIDPDFKALRGNPRFERLAGGTA